MSTLRVQLCALAEFRAESALEYEVLDTTRRIVERGSAVPAALPRRERTELVVAAPDVLLLDCAPPPLSGARLRAAFHALAEPHLLSDIEGAYVVAARARAVDRTTLAVVDRMLFERALELLRRAGIQVNSATPEQLALPLNERRWHMRVRAGYSCLRTGPLAGITCAVAGHDAPPVELRLALDQAGEARPESIEVEGDCDCSAWADELRLQVVPAGVATVAPLVALELLQYELAPRLVAWNAWKVPAALAALCALVWIVGLNVDAWRLRREERALRAGMTAALREALPSVPVVLDPLKQMQRAVSDLRVGTGKADMGEFLPLATALAKALPQEPEAVRALEFRDQTLRVEFEPRALEPSSKRDFVLKTISAAGFAGRFSESTLSVRAKADGS
ncbi:MAG TPA: type II secretion system protein GspL [Burkholderiales bacterium]|nr:type II secretion system protein GspL [Burkholderiales bacterium]